MWYNINILFKEDKVYMLTTKEDVKKEKTTKEKANTASKNEDFDFQEDEELLSPEEEALFDTPSEEDSEESKSERFKRVSGRRVNSIVKSLNLLGGMADQTSNYDYSKEEVAIMFNYIEKALETAKTQYADKKVAPFNW